MAQSKVNIHGYVLYMYDYNALKYAIRYLSSLNAEQFDTIIDGARADGTGDFRDAHGGNYAVEYEFRSKSYRLVKRE